jgi:hypothetical protein
VQKKPNRYPFSKLPKGNDLVMIWGYFYALLAFVCVLVKKTNVLFVLYF